MGVRAHAQKRAHALGTDLGNRILLMILLSWSSLSHSSSSGRRPHARAHTGTRSDVRVTRHLAAAPFSSSASRTSLRGKTSKSAELVSWVVVFNIQLMLGE